MKALLAACTLSLALSTTAQAQSELSALSAAPLVLSVTAVSATGAALSMAPAALLSAGTALVVVSVEVVGDVTHWVLARASDGARLSLRTTGRVSQSVFVHTGIAVVVSVVAAGTVLSVAGEVIAFIPNQIGQALLHNEKVSR